MQKFRNKFVLAALAAAALLPVASAQNAAVEHPSAAVLRIGHRLACLCGCNDTVATCQMLDCSFSMPAKEKIAKMVAAGMSDQAIINSFVAQYGQRIYRAAPSPFGWIVPYASLLLGLGVIGWFLRRYRRPKPIAEFGPAIEVDDPQLAKYRDQIEKELSHLD